MTEPLPVGCADTGGRGPLIDAGFGTRPLNRLSPSGLLGD